MGLFCILEMLTENTYIPFFEHMLRHSTELFGCMLKTSHLKDLLICSQTLQGRYAGNLAPQGLLRLKQLKLWSMGPEYLEIIPNDLISLERRKRSTTHTHWRQDVQVCMLHLLQFPHLTGYRLPSLSPGPDYTLVKGFKPHLQPKKGSSTLAFGILPKTLTTLLKNYLIFNLNLFPFISSLMTVLPRTASHPIQFPSCC